MNDHSKTKAELIKELESLRKQISVDSPHGPELNNDSALAAFQNFLLTSPTAINTFQLLEDDRLILTLINPAAERMTGLDTSSILGKEIVEAFPGLRDTDIPEMYRAVARGELGTQHYEHHYKDDRFEGWFELTVHRIHENQIGVQTIDITEQKLMQQELQTREENYRTLSLLKKAILESPDGIIVFALDSAYCYLDFTSIHKQTMQKLWGVTINRGDNMLDCIKDSSDRKKAKENFDRALQGERFVLEEAYGDEHLHRAFYENRYSPVYDENETIVGLSVFVIDVTERRLADQALRELQAQQSAMISNISDVIGIIDSNGMMKFKSPNIKKYFGWTPEELIGTDGFMNIHPDDEDRLRDEFGKLLLEQNSVTTVECRYKCKDGSYKPIQLTANNLTHDPNIQGVLLNYRDNSEYQQIFEKLRNSEEVFRKAFITSPDSISINRLGDGKYVSINQSFTLMTGYSESEVMGKTPTEIKLWKHPEDRDELVSELQKTGSVKNLEVEFQTKQGTNRFGLMSATLIELDSVPHILSFTRDISDRKEAVRDLRKSEARYRSLFEDAPLGVALIHSFTGQFLEVNTMFSTISGHSPEALVATNWMAITHPDDIEEDLGNMRRMNAGEINGFQMKKRYVRPDNSFVWINLTITKVKDADPLQPHHLAMIEDITAQRLAAEALQKSEERFTLAMRASNDGLFDWDLVSNDIYYSPGWKRMLGYEDHELPNDFSVWEKTTDPEDVKKSWELQKKLIAQEIDRFVMEFRMKHKDGHWVDILSRAEALFDENGTATRIVGTHTDITESKRVEQALRKSEAERRAIADYTYDWESWSAKDGSLRWVNPAVEKLTGYSIADCKAMSNYPIPIIHSDEKKSFEELLHTAISDQGSMNNYEFRILHKNGSVRWMAASWQPIFDDSGRHIGQRTSMRDITERKQIKLSLEASERRYLGLVDQSPIAYEVYDADGVQLKVNRAYEKLWGMSAKDSVGRFNVRTDPQVETLGLKPYVERAYAGESVRLPEFQWDPGLSGFPGRARWLSTRIYPIKDAVDQILNVVITHEDITERRVAEQELAQSERDYRGLFDLAHDAIILFEDKDEIVVEANQRACDLYGYPREEFIGLSLTAISTNVGLGKARVEEVLERGSIKQFETSQKRKDGSIITVEVNASKATYQGKSVILSLNHDITNRKQAEQILKTSEEKLQRAQSIARLGFWEWDLKTDKGHWSEQTYRMFGYEPDELEITFEWLLRHMNPEDVKPVSEGIERAVKDQSAFDMEYRVIKKDGSEIVVHSIGQVTMDRDGKTTGMEGILQDITESKRAEEERLTLEAQLRQAQKLEAIGTMVGGISHEFNNVLQSMFLYAEMVEDKLPDNEELRSNFRHILDAGYRARDLIRQILTFSRKAKVEVKPQPLHELVPAVLALERASLPANIDIQQDIDPDCGLVMCDTTQIHQILINLCNNAQHAMAEHGGILTVSLKPARALLNNSDLEKDVVELIVSDTGHGIDAADLERIFDPFFTTKKVGDGTGLGLSVIHGIIEMLEGQIVVTSEPGKGATFRIFFPVTEHTPNVEQAAAESKPLQRSLSILLVDDAESIRQATQLALSRKGYIIESASDGKQALELFKANPGKYDLIVTDQSMPRMSGIELTQAIRKDDQEIPVILSTGHLGVEEQQSFKGVGINSFIQKPWTAEELVERIQELDHNS